MKRLLTNLVIALTAAFSVAAQAQEITLRAHHFWPAHGIPPTKILQPWCDKIAAESNGRINCQLFAAMQLGGTPPQLINQVRDGVVDIVFTLPGYTAGSFPIMEVFELPFMIRSAEASSKAAWEFYEKYAQKEFASVKPLMFAVHEPGYIHTRNKQVRESADFKGMKIRGATRMLNRMLVSLGASPVAMPQSAVSEALNKGVIDGFFLPWEPIPAARLHEAVKFHTETPSDRPALFTHVFVVAMNKARYDGLPSDLKAIIDRNSGISFSAAAGKTWDELGVLGRKSAEQRGNSFYMVPATEMDKWAKAVAPLHDEWIASMNGAGMSGKQMLEDARAMIDKHLKR